MSTVVSRLGGGAGRVSRPPVSPRLVGAALATLAALHASPARAWWFVEHSEIGATAYLRACEDVARELPAKSETPAATAAHVRYEIACGDLGVMARIYGQATALAGDRIDRPEDFLSATGDWKATSKRHYLALQLVDVDHFHPQSLRRWSRYHRQAVALAVRASKTQGLEAIEAYRAVFYRNAYSDHFLQDSFAAGHMGFNRAASSIAATTAFHRVWNRRGRHVRNRRGDSWVTYGDGLLNAEKNAEGKRQVIEASSLAAYGLVSAFVKGERDYEHELAIWRALPFLIEAPEIRSLTERVFEDEDADVELYPLEAVNRPARTDKVFDLWFLARSHAQEQTRPLLAGLLGFDVALPLVSRAYLALGGTVPYDDHDLRFMAQLELHRQLGISAEGLIAHQGLLGVTWEARSGELAGDLHAGYQLTFELGLNLVRLQAGPALTFPGRDIGYFAAIGYGRPFDASGGGVR